MVYTEDRLRPN